MMPARELNSLAEVIHAAIKADKRTPMGIAFAVAASGFGSAELVRLQSLMNAQPADLSEAQLEALVDAGNAALSDYYHDRACACSDYPESCYTNSAYARAQGFWDTDAFAVGAPAVIGLWEVLRAADDAAELAALRIRNAELEALVLAAGAAAEQRHQLLDPSEPALGCFMTGPICALALADALADPLAVDVPPVVTA